MIEISELRELFKSSRKLIFVFICIGIGLITVKPFLESYFTELGKKSAQVKKKEEQDNQPNINIADTVQNITNSNPLNRNDEQTKTNVVQEVKISETISSRNEQTKVITPKEVEIPKVIFSGYIFDENNVGISNVNLVLAGYGKKIQTDSSGYFFSYLESKSQKRIEVIVKKEGYSTFVDDVVLPKRNYRTQLQSKND